MKIRFFRLACIFITVTICFSNFAIAQSKVEYDIVLIGGRVIDPSVVVGVQ